LQRISAEQYYQETFVSKGSDETPMERKLLKSGFVDVVPKQEISDKEIDSAWEMFRIQNPNTVGGFQDQYLSFCFAIKWYREHLEKLKD
jgi:predicted metal-dependent phosphoesterase TrpH